VAGHGRVVGAVLAIRVHSPDATVSRLHRPLFWVRVTAGALAVWWGLVFYGLIDLLAFLQGPEFHDSILLSTGWGLLFLFLVAGPLTVLAVRSESDSAAASAQIGCVTVALVIAAFLGQSAGYLLAAAGMAFTLALVMVLGATSVAATLSTWRWSTPPALMVALAVVPLAHYAWVSASNTHTGVTTDDTFSLDHWPAQAALAVAALLIAALAAGHPRGWQVPTWSVAASGAWFAVACWLEPHLVGTVSRPWAAALLVWCVAFAVVTHLTTPASTRASPSSARARR
jgi:hypothetical protein